MKRDPQWEALLSEALDDREPSPEMEERVLTNVQRRRRVSDPHTDVSRPPFWATRWAAWRVAAATVCASALWVYQTNFNSQVNIPHKASVTWLQAEQPHVLAEGVRVLPRADTRVRVDDEQRTQLLNLDDGTVLVHVPPLSKQVVQLDAGDLRVTVTGTVFGVTKNGNGKSAVSVWEGSVELTQHGRSHRLDAGQTYPSHAPQLALSQRDLELLQATERVVLPTAETRAVPGSDASAERAPVAATKPALGTSAKTTTTPLATKLASSYTAAQRLEASGARLQAARVYEQVASAGQTESEAALFAAARIYYGDGQHDRAYHLLRTYRSRYPHGSYARAVDVLVLRVLVAEENDTQVLRESESFLSRYPSDPRAQQFRLARARVWARQGNCARVKAELSHLPDHRLELNKLCP